MPSSRTKVHRNSPDIGHTALLVGCLSISTFQKPRSNYHPLPQCLNWMMGCHHSLLTNLSPSLCLKRAFSDPLPDSESLEVISSPRIRDPHHQKPTQNHGLGLSPGERCPPNLLVLPLSVFPQLQLLYAPFKILSESFENISRPMYLT